MSLCCHLKKTFSLSFSGGEEKQGDNYQAIWGNYLLCNFEIAADEERVVACFLSSRHLFEHKSFHSRLTVLWKKTPPVICGSVFITWPMSFPNGMWTWRHPMGDSARLTGVRAWSNTLSCLSNEIIPFVIFPGSPNLDMATYMADLRYSHGFLHLFYFSGLLCSSDLITIWHSVVAILVVCACPRV